MPKLQRQLPKLHRLPRLLDRLELQVAQRLDRLESSPVLAPRNYMGLGFLLILLTGLTIYFWGGLVSLLAAWSKPEYSHGPLIPLIAGFLLLRELKNEKPGEIKGSETPGLLVILFGLLVGLLGNISQIPYFMTYGLLIAVGGLILLVAGARRGVRFWAPWVYLLFVLPLPNTLYWQVSTKLQLFSSFAGVEFIRAMGVPVLLEGNVIDLGVYRLHVAEACSGLRYLFPLASFGFLFAVIYQGPFWQKFLLFISTIPITIFMNSFRIGVIGLLVNTYGVEQAEGFLHWFEGWVIFVACLTILFIEAWILQRFLKNPKSMLGMLDLDWSGIVEPAKSIVTLSPTRMLMIASVVCLGSGLVWQLSPSWRPSAPDRMPFAIFPIKLGDWTGEEQRSSSLVRAALEADDIISMNYKSSHGEEIINFFSTYYVSTSDGTGIHSPEVCIPGGGWEVSKWSRHTIDSGQGDASTFVVNRAVIQKEQERQVVYYWFEMRGSKYVSEYRAKIQTVIDSVTMARADGGLVRLITPLSPGESESDGDKRLSQFIPIILPTLNDYIPK